MGLNKSFQRIILSVGSFYLEVCNFFFPRRCKFITSADANGCHMFLLAIRPQLHKSPYPQAKLEVAPFRKMDDVDQKELQSTEGRAVSRRECCADKACCDFG